MEHLQFKPKEGRTPQGVRGLKHKSNGKLSGPGRRTPQGVRGLKLVHVYDSFFNLQSHSARSAWIETGKRVRKV